MTTAPTVISRQIIMALPLKGIFCTLTLLLVSSHVADCVKVILGDPFTFPVNCEPGESGTLLRVFWDGGTSKVATYQRGEWTVIKNTDRIKSNSSKIFFTHTVYNDRGVYELSCKPKDLVQLEVVVAFEVSVTEDETATLPCYFETTGKTGLTAVWEKNGKPVCVMNSSSDGCSGTSPDRLSESKDRFAHGDLSLTMKRVQPGDRGDYFCYVRDQHGNHSGNPAAVRLIVREKKSHQITTTATPRNQTQSSSEQTNPWMISTLVLGVSVLLALVAILIWRHVKPGCDSKKMYELVKGSLHTSPPNEATIVFPPCSR